MRAAQMAQKTGMRLIGALENMSYLVGTARSSSVRAAATSSPRRSSAPLLGRIPLDPRLREQADLGEPLVWAEPENETARAIYEVAEAITEAGARAGHGQEAAPARDVETEGRPEAPSRSRPDGF